MKATRVIGSTRGPCCTLTKHHVTESVKFLVETILEQCLKNDEYCSSNTSIGLSVITLYENRNNDAVHSPYTREAIIHLPPSTKSDKHSEEKTVERAVLAPPLFA